MSELITVIVPVYNTEKYLKRCVDSILAQSYSDFELFLVDDGSKDSSGDMCDELALLDNRIKVIHQENAGVSVARNNALDNMSGDYVVFIDSDDYIDKDYLSVLYSNMSDDVDLVVSKPKAINPDGSDYRYWEFNATEAITLEPEDVRNMDWQYRHFWVHSVLFRASAIGDIRFNPEFLVSQDTPFYCEVFKGSRKVKYIPEKLYIYIMYQESACHGKFTDRKFTEFYAWQKILSLFEGHPLYELYLSNYVMRCYRLYMAMLDAGLSDDERTYRLIGDIKKYIKYGVKIEGFPLFYKREFVMYSILPKSTHMPVHKAQQKYFEIRSSVVKPIKKMLGKV